MMVQNELRVYLYSTDDHIPLKYADLDIAVYGGNIRFHCVVELDENQDIRPETLRLNSLSQSEFLFDGSAPNEDVLVYPAKPLPVGDNIYPLSCVRNGIYNMALLQAVAAIVNHRYSVDYC